MVVLPHAFQLVSVPLQLSNSEKMIVHSIALLSRLIGSGTQKYRLKSGLTLSLFHIKTPKKGITKLHLLYNLTAVKDGSVDYSLLLSLTHYAQKLKKMTPLFLC